MDTEKKIKEIRANIKRDRSYFFSQENDNADYNTDVLIKTRDKSIQSVDAQKYVDLCWYDNIKNVWSGVLDINKIPNAERIRLGGLYKNTGVILYCSLDDIDKIIALAKEEKAVKEKLNKEIKEKFKNI